MISNNYKQTYSSSSRRFNKDGGSRLFDNSREISNNSSADYINYSSRSNVINNNMKQCTQNGIDNNNVCSNCKCNQQQPARFISKPSIKNSRNNDYKADSSMRVFNVPPPPFKETFVARAFKGIMPLASASTPTLRSSMSPAPTLRTFTPPAPTERTPLPSAPTVRTPSPPAPMMQAGQLPPSLLDPAPLPKMLLTTPPRQAASSYYPPRAIRGIFFVFVAS